MPDYINIHLVFSEAEQDIIEAINKYCLITGMNNSLDDLYKWVQEGGGKDPDLFLINCGEFFVNYNERDKTRKRTFQQIIAGIKKYRPKSRVVLLLPEMLEHDLDIIRIILGLELYDIWFLDRYNEADLINSIMTKRTLPDLEEYLKERAEARKNTSAADKNYYSVSRRLKKIYQPYYVKSNVITFWSEEDAFISHALALLTAMDLAGRGFKVALIETVSSIPRLASSLSVPHPYFNTRHALTMYAQSNNNFHQDCLFNNDKYLNDKNSPGRYAFIEDYPKDLYLLPDGIRDDNLSWAEMESGWRGFITDLSKVIIFEKNFHFLIFTCCGKSIFNDFVMNELSYLRFITINMLPCSIVYGINERKKGKGKVHIIGTKNKAYINNQLTDLNESLFLYPPVRLAEDFLEFVYLKRATRISSETRTFIQEIIKLLGLKLAGEEDLISNSRISRLKKLLRK